MVAAATIGVIGYLTSDETLARIVHIYVRKPWQRRGIGKALLDAVCARAPRILAGPLPDWALSSMEFWQRSGLARTAFGGRADGESMAYFGNAAWLQVRSAAPSETPMQPITLDVARVAAVRATVAELRANGARMLLMADELERALAQQP